MVEYWVTCILYTKFHKQKEVRIVGRICLLFGGIQAV